ncbi:MULTISPECIES: hypothetical protein [unclassified Azospirillum]|uniref:hypothetical protein n=1 Tax=unclassified Azospirillum TaxID=2630922 RepID=UPI000B6261E7|nr:MULTISPECIES: hypothetical protein [unclassified Azospirillum]SNS62862.1 hypothetical protein SAMN05880556_108122 [Azospirillum sp. RU38E]SNS82015.1 hypothetical protein SAMN05880591_108122 [Azospirillum sp. RU37A]
MIKKPPPRPPRSSSPATENGGGAFDDRLKAAELERLRRQATDSRLREKLQEAAKARGDDPYQLLAQAIRRMLRGE